MKQILESLDEAIFTPELKESIQGLYENALATIKEEYELKLTDAEIKLQEAENASKVIVEEYEVKMQEKEADLLKGAEEYAEYIKEEMTAKANAYADTLKLDYEAKAEAYGHYVNETFQGKYIDTMDLFLNRSVEEYLEENRLVAEHSLQEAKISALLEGFDSLLSTGAIEIANLGQEGTESKEVEEITELKESVTKLIKENDVLKKANVTLKKEGVISSLTEGMSAIELDKFEKLSKVVSFNGTDIDIYTTSLKSIKESIVSKVADEEILEAKTLTESIKEPSYRRFIK